MNPEEEVGGDNQEAKFSSDFSGATQIDASPAESAEKRFNTDNLKSVQEEINDLKNQLDQYKNDLTLVEKPTGSQSGRVRYDQKYSNPEAIRLQAEISKLQRKHGEILHNENKIINAKTKIEQATKPSYNINKDNKNVIPPGALNSEDVRRELGRMEEVNATPTVVNVNRETPAQDEPSSVKPSLFDKFKALLKRN
jgi:hypothetical protein